MARLLPTALVLALLCGTAAAFAVTEHLKLERSPILATRVDKVFSPVCRCRRSRARIGFRLRHPDRLTLAVVDSAGKVVRTVVRSESVRRGFHEFTWDGRDDNGHVLPQGSYKPRVHLARAHRTILLPNPIALDTGPPSIFLVSVRPRVFSPDGDYRRDYLNVGFRATEPVRALLLVRGKLRVRERRFRAVGVFHWYAPRGLPAGRYRLTLRAEDRAGNAGPQTRPQIVVVRYVRLARHVIRVRAGARFVVGVSTDARFYHWRIGYRSGRGRSRRLALRAPVPGRYQLVVSERGHRDSATLIVGAP